MLALILTWLGKELEMEEMLMWGIGLPLWLPVFVVLEPVGVGRGGVVSVGVVPFVVAPFGVVEIAE